MVLTLGWVGQAAAQDPPNQCEQHWCYCDGMPGPKTLTGCNGSCEDACGSSSAGGGGQSGSKRRFPKQRFSFGFLGGPGPTVVDRAGTESHGAFMGGMDVRAVAGGQPLLGVELLLGMNITSVTAPHFGNDAEVMFFVPFMAGLTSSPRLLRGNKVELRLDLGADIGFMYRAACSTCDDDNLSKVALIYQLHAGIDTYTGKKKEAGFGLDAVVMLGNQGDVHDQSSPSAVEVQPSTFLIRLAFLWRNNDLRW